MELEQALACVRAAGFRVSKTKEKKLTVAQRVHGKELNAVGKPYSEQYDPNYRMKYKTRRYPWTPGQRSDVGNGISPERWRVMCDEAAAAWAIFMQGE